MNLIQDVKYRATTDRENQVYLLSEMCVTPRMLMDPPVFKVYGGVLYIREDVSFDPMISTTETLYFEN